MTAEPAADAEITGPALACEGLTKRFGDLTAVDDVSFAIDHSVSYGLLGPNGAGKTTIINLVCGLLRPDAGTVTVAGQALAGNRAVKGAIGYVPQEVALYPELTGRENLRFFGRLYGLSGQALKDRITAGLELAGLTERADDRVEEYSGGMRRRLNIAAGLLHEPSLLVLDEPTVGVDPQSRNAILTTVADLRSQGLAVLYTSHYMEEVEKLCDRIGIIDEGSLIAEGTTAELVDSLGEKDRVTLTLDGDTAFFVKAAAGLYGVTRVTSTSDGVELLAENGTRRLPELIGIAARTNLTVTSVDVHRPNLEAVFLQLTGKALRD